MIFSELIKNHRKTIVVYIGLGIVISVLQAFGTNALQRLLDGVSAHSLTISSIVLYGGLITAVYLLNYVYNIPDSRLDNGIYLDLKLMALRKMSVINYADYQGIGIGTLIQQIENGATAGTNILFGFYFRLFRELMPDVIISLIFISIINVTLTWFVLLGYVVVFIITNIVLKSLYKIKSHILINEESMNQRLVRGIMELVVFRTNKRFAAEMDKTRQAADTIVVGKTKMLMTHESFFTIFALLVIALKVAMLFYGLFTGALSIGEIVALMAFLDKAYQPIAVFNVLYVQYKLDKVTFQRYEDVLRLPEDAALNRGEKIDITEGKLSFENVSFDYENKAVLKNLSFAVAPHSSVAFVGESGAGKSTIIKQIVGLVKPKGGTILVDGHDLARMDLNHYYDFISYTSQDSPVFGGTLYENIVFDRQVGQDEIENVLNLVHLGAFYKSLGQGLATQVGERGLLLSGGERQRLALARIFFQKAKIIVLDEATSAMDNLTEEAVMNNVMRAVKDKTLIVIAHRLSSIRNVDHIFALKDGSIVQQGNFDELMRDGGYFRELWNRESEKQ